MRSNAQACARCCRLSGASKSKPYLPSIWARMKVGIGDAFRLVDDVGQLPLGRGRRHGLFLAIGKAGHLQLDLGLGHKRADFRQAESGAKAIERNHVEAPDLLNDGANASGRLLPPWCQQRLRPAACARLPRRYAVRRRNRPGARRTGGERAPAPARPAPSAGRRTRAGRRSARSSGQGLNLRQRLVISEFAENHHGQIPFD